MGRRSSIVIIAEGARDVSGRSVTSADVKHALDSAGFDCRITILGHVQRGGSPCAFDRNMVCI
jgi:6-phosphofructokinase 1